MDINWSEYCCKWSQKCWL